MTPRTRRALIRAAAERRNWDRFCAFWQGLADLVVPFSAKVEPASWTFRVA